MNGNERQLGGGVAGVLLSGVVVAFLVLPAGALASTASVGKNKLEFRASGGEVNKVIVRDDPDFAGYLVTDIGNTIKPNPDKGCVRYMNAANTVDCQPDPNSDFFIEVVQATLGDGDDSLSGFADVAYKAVGGAGDDSLVGNAEPDVLVGSAGNDYIEGGDEEDTLTGSGGIDTIFAADGYVDRVSCGGHGDTWVTDPDDVVKGCKP